MSSEAAGIARRAAEVIQRRGLHKGAFTDGRGLDVCSFCISGALNYARSGAPADDLWQVDTRGHDIVWAIEDRIHLDDMATWNDRPGTTAEDVVALLLAVADDLDAQ